MFWAEEELEHRKEAAQKWCEVGPEDAKMRDLVFEWAMTDTRGTTPFRELGGGVVEQLVRLVVLAMRKVREDHRADPENGATVLGDSKSEVR